MTHHTDNLPDPELAIPAGATADGWYSITREGVLVRSLEWSRHDTDKVGISVDGSQDATGAVSRGISLYGVAGQSLTAEEARQLAAALIGAAGQLDRLSDD